jgi:hypothetical protein
MAIRITSKKNGFRRCGIAHPDQPTLYPDDAFTPGQLQALKAEPMLIVDTGVSGPEKDPGADHKPSNPVSGLNVQDAIKKKTK